MNEWYTWLQWESVTDEDDLEEERSGGGEMSFSESKDESKELSPLSLNADDIELEMMNDDDTAFFETGAGNRTQ